MTTGSASGNEGREQRRAHLVEWLGQRRYPHPEFYDSLEELSPSLASLARQSLPSSHHVEGVLSVPAEYHARKMLTWEFVPERALLFLDRGALYIKAGASGIPPETLLIDVDSLLYVRSSLLLLYGLLEIKADCGAEPGEVRLEYNTVIWHALHDPLARLIASATAPCGLESGPAVRAANAALLKTLPFKFANGLRYYALVPGERLCAVAFQPTIWRRGFLPSQVTPNTLLALTDSKVVLIEEQPTLTWRRQPSQGEYGWIFTYIPRDRVVDMVVTPGERWAELTMQLQWGGARDQRSFLLEPAVAAKWERSWHEAHTD